MENSVKSVLEEIEFDASESADQLGEQPALTSDEAAASAAWQATFHCCSHAAHLDSTITATHSPALSQPLNLKSTGSYQCQAAAGPPTRRGPALLLGHFGVCSVVPFHRTTY
ncbi:hypothetical protein ACOMHN_047583 [Nucella lapillus]